MPPDLKVSVIMPVFNERDTLAEVVGRVVQQACVTELIAVDDHSTDGSREVLGELATKYPYLRPLYHPENLGKGAALRTGIEHAIGDVVLFQDADLQYDPADYPRLIAPIGQGLADAVYGSRYIGQQGKREAYFGQYYANRFLTLLSNLLSGLALTDMETCYKAIRREMIQKITIEEDRFGVEPEVTAKLAALRARFVEVPISYTGRSHSAGKKIGWKDGIAAIGCILKYSRRPPR
jgi:glycosyltransferase involved in cell wall biosynthesis